MPIETSNERPLKVVILVPSFAENMGYATNCLPKAMVDCGAEVHVITTKLSPNYDQKDFQTSYGSFHNNSKTAESKVIDGYTVSYLDHRMLLGMPAFKGLQQKMQALKPDVVQTFQPISWSLIQAVFAKFTVGYKLCTGNHTTASVFPLALKPWWSRGRLKDFCLRTVQGRVISYFTEKCYGATSDCSEIARRFFGVPQHKIVTVPLGTDTDIFYPPVDVEARRAARSKLGFTDDDIVCVYTGRYSEDKNPLILALAIDKLAAAGEPFKGLFYGNGVQAERIAKCRGVTLQSFIPFAQLGTVFRMADIGIWPTQESTSMIDAAACGLPIIVNHTLQDRERIEGNGITYQLNRLRDYRAIIKGEQ
jgi:glycosyltransferase involved in cell wall biosynthesis